MNSDRLKKASLGRRCLNTCCLLPGYLDRAKATFKERLDQSQTNHRRPSQEAYCTPWQPGALGSEQKSSLSWPSFSSNPAARGMSLFSLPVINVLVSSSIQPGSDG